MHWCSPPFSDQTSKVNSFQTNLISGQLQSDSVWQVARARCVQESSIHSLIPLVETILVVISSTISAERTRECNLSNKFILCFHFVFSLLWLLLLIAGCSAVDIRTSTISSGSLVQMNFIWWTFWCSWIVKQRASKTIMLSAHGEHSRWAFSMKIHNEHSRRRFMRNIRQSSQWDKTDRSTICLEALNWNDSNGI